ncbi:MAG TPA: M17 family peptidase N-terminal domain-containing protein [Vulgatibacter sp.]|nr:M17 family peptidase N-terminal domain-containing protein [Vulgatibacter sp.]
MSEAVSRPLATRVLPLDLEGLDALDGEDLVAFAGLEDRPLRGLAGLVDWRACGKLTRLVKDGVFAGEAGEALIALPAGSVRIRRLFVMGKGTKLEAALERVRRAGGERVAIALDGGPWEAPLRAVHAAGFHAVTLLTADPKGAERALDAAMRALPWLRRLEAEEPAPASKSA